MVSNQGLKIDGSWYYFQTSGAMLRGWRDKGSDRYYYDENGRMQAGGPVDIDGTIYVFDTSGRLIQ